VFYVKYIFKSFIFMLLWFSPKSSLRRQKRHEFLPAACRIHSASLKDS
jgi:hypothetical protein